MKSFRFPHLILIIPMILSACNLGATPPVPGAVSTSAAQTVEALLTPAVNSNATQTLPAFTEAPTACKDEATNTAWTRDHALYDVKAVNTPLAQNKPFFMAWTFLNTGSCIWKDGYRMVFESGTSMTASTSFPVLQAGQSVAPGQTVTVEIPMTTPGKDGEYQAVWNLQNDHDTILMSFGVTIKVGSASSQTLKNPGDLRYTYDCTSGVVRIDLFWIDAANNEDGYRITRDGNLLGEVPAGTTTYSDIAPGVGEYDYVVAAYNAAGESPTKVHVKTKNCQ
jgi:hypothetical protein